MDVEKTIEFILGQMGRFSEALAVQGENIVRITERLDRLTDRVDKLSQDVKVMARAMNALIEVCDEQRSAINTMSEEVHRIDANVNVLIKTVDDLVRRDNPQ